MMADLVVANVKREKNYGMGVTTQSGLVTIQSDIGWVSTAWGIVPADDVQLLN